MTEYQHESVLSERTTYPYLEMDRSKSGIKGRCSHFEMLPPPSREPPPQSESIVCKIASV